MRKCLIIPPVLLALAVAAWPQVRGGGFGGGFGRPGFGNPGFGNRFGFFGRQGFPASLVFFGDPLIYPDYSSLAADQPVPSLIVVQSNPNPAPSTPPSEPLMIVWQGDRYVRYGGGTKADQVHTLADYAGSNSSTGQGRSSAHSSSSGEVKPPQLPPAVLVFRDGHREQVHDYVIASGKLYLRGNYWRDGYWTRTVELAALDVPQTLSANQQNGVIFVLPTAPNEVVTRP
ncbi:MAG TPA: hypothetical protein VEI99_00760 [Terriglobales bacterium]|nr:hypothetical protein [Terriglobales bacterium]